MRRIALASLVVLITALVAAPRVDAAAITIRIGGIDAVYDGADLYDAGSQLGGNQNVSEADALSSVEILLGSTVLGTLVTDIHADFAFVGLTPIPVGGGVVGSPFGGFFDLLTNGAFGLGLDFDSASLDYSGGAVTVTGLATLIAGQALPFGLQIGKPIEVTLAFLGLANLTDNGQRLTGFTATGAGEVVGHSVPEPAALALFAIGLARVATRMRRGSPRQVRSEAS